MNKVIIVDREVPTIEPFNLGTNLHDFEGTVWRKRSEIVMFAQVGYGEFGLISLVNGNRCNDPTSDYKELNEALEGYTQLKSTKLQITTK